MSYTVIYVICSFSFLNTERKLFWTCKYVYVYTASVIIMDNPSSLCLYSEAVIKFYLSPNTDIAIVIK